MSDDAFLRPLSVRIGPLTWRISYDPMEYRQHGLANNDLHNTGGFTLHHEGAIYVDVARNEENFVRDLSLIHI